MEQLLLRLSCLSRPSHQGCDTSPRLFSALSLTAAAMSGARFMTLFDQILVPSSPGEELATGLGRSSEDSRSDSAWTTFSGSAQKLVQFEPKSLACSI